MTETTKPGGTVSGYSSVTFKQGLPEAWDIKPDGRPVVHVDDLPQPTPDTVEIVRKRLADGRTIADSDVHRLVRQIDRLRVEMTTLHGLDVTTREGQHVFNEWRNRSVKHGR